MKLSNTTIRELSKKYRSILKKCAILNAALFMVAVSQANAAGIYYGTSSNGWTNSSPNPAVVSEFNGTVNTSILPFLDVDTIVYGGYTNGTDNVSENIITPTIPFSIKEIENLCNYVWKGGRLIIIADHTNLYGHADVLNPLLHNFQAHLNDDTLYDNLDYYKQYHIKIPSFLLSKMSTKTNSSLHLPFYSHVWGISDVIIFCLFFSSSADV